MVTTITLNPMLDKTVGIDRLQRGAIHRSSEMKMVAGGKGINVSRQLRLLGIKTTATGFLGGEIGSIISRLLTAETIEHDFVTTNAMTREGLTLRESDGVWTAVFEPSLPIDAESVHKLNRKIDFLASKSAWLVCGGSSPANVVDDVYYEAILSAHRHGITSVLDSYGYAFELGLKAQPTLVKPARHEFEMTFGQALKTETDYINAINFLLKSGARYCVISDGANPFYGGIQGHYWKVMPPPVKLVNSTGSGDAMVASILYGFHQGWKFERCLAFGAAAGAANARKWDVANSSREEIASLESYVVMQRL
jgi:1-phosphofructokinase family hexose kinase